MQASDGLLTVVPAITIAIQSKVLPIWHLASGILALHRLILLAFYPHKY